MSLSEQIASLVNPVPVFHDPEDDHDKDTVAKIADFEDAQYGDGQDDLVTSSLRARASATFNETDPRYAGKKTSRKRISEHAQDDESEDSEEESDVDMEAIKHFKERMARRANINYEPADESTNESEGESADSDQLEDKTKIEELEKEKQNTASTMLTFSTATPHHLQEDAEKGRAIKRQLALWDALLKSRIQMQKAMVAANQVPRHDIWADFCQQGGQNFHDVIDDCGSKVQNLLDDLLSLQTSLLASNPETRTVLDSCRNAHEGTQEQNNEEILSDDAEDEVDRKDKIKEIVQRKKRKFMMEEYPEFLNKRHCDFQRFRDATIQKWNERTKLTRGKMKSFDKFEQSTLKQIELILYDKARLIKRTQIKRTAYVTLGRNANRILPTTTKDGSQQHPDDTDDLTAAVVADELNEIDAEIFDDNDFYHQILREVIERKTADVSDSFALGRQWLQIQKLRSKMKKKVDTKASKGRKIRYDVHAKLVNFMAAIDTTSLPNEAKNELFNSLFGKRNKLQ